VKISEILAKVKASEDASAIGLVVLTTSERALRVAAAFDMMPAPIIHITSDSRMGQIIEHDLIEETDVVTILDALWECTHVEFGDLAMRAGLHMRETAKAVLYELRTNFMIYPDGTLHSKAREYLVGLTTPRKKDAEPEAVE